MTPSAPSFEHLPSALGIGTATPRISWITTADPAWRQAAYEVRVERGGRAAEFRVASADSVLVPWPDAPLASRESATVSVRVVGEDGIPSDWSVPATVETGLLDPSDWTASGIGPGWDEDPGEDLRRPPLLRREFTIAGEVARARLYVTAHGLHELELNGRRVGDEALEPGWTEYRERLRYRTHDVTGLLAPGANVVGAWLGDGWWRGRIGFDGGTLNVYGSRLGLLAQLEVEYADGSRQVLATDGEWTAHPSPILSSGLYAGETFDVREVPAGWSADEEDRWVHKMVTRLDKGAARRRPGDEELQRRALELSRRFFDDVREMPVPVSVSWSDRQQRRWGSCTPAEGTIRLSRRLSGMPAWVLDYVLVHELAHLLVPDHSPRFWEHVERYPLAERAKGFLMGVASVDEQAPQARPPLGLPQDVGEDVE